jgi:hypothetical protein
MGSLDVTSLIITSLFGAVGFVAFVFGKKESLWKTMLLGVCLMGYGFVVTGTWPQILTGAALTAALFIFKE